MRKMPKRKDVGTYIAAAPRETQSGLRTLRKAIRQVVPNAEERISYGMPYYSYRGRLAYFAVFKNHIGLYIPSPIVEKHKNELRNYQTAKATVRFPLGKRLPIALIKKLVRAQMKRNEARRVK